jgi:hypothetical protein
MQPKRKLTVISNNSPVVKNTTCFATQAKFKVNCQRQNCPQWIDHSEGHNCVLIAAQSGPHTLQKIGQIYGLTRMRICQIEKGIFDKVRNIES